MASIKIFFYSLMCMIVFILCGVFNIIHSVLSAFIYTLIFLSRYVLIVTGGMIGLALIYEIITSCINGQFQLILCYVLMLALLLVTFIFLGPVILIPLQLVLNFVLSAILKIIDISEMVSDYLDSYYNSLLHKLLHTAEEI